MDLKDLFKGVLDDDAIAKIEANSTLRTRLQRGSEFVDLLDTGEVPPELPKSGAGLSLTDLTNALKTSLTDFETRFTPKIDERVKAITEPLVEKFTSELAAASSRAAYLADTMGQIRHEHKETFGEAFDETKLNAWVKEQITGGRNFGNVREAYDAWTGPQRMEKQLAAAREEGKRDAMSGKAVPGVSSSPATGIREKLRAFHSGNNSGKTRTEVLDEKLAALDRRNQAVA